MSGPNFFVSPGRARQGGIVGLTLAAVLAVAGCFAPTVILHGYLVAFASLGGVALGCTAWLAIHALTGGRWGTESRPALVAGATALPLFVVLMLPLVLSGRWLYPWAADPGNAGPGVAALYLNGFGFAARAVLLLGGLGLVAWQARSGPLSRPVAAMALVLYGGLMNLSAFDWLLSLDPHYTSSAFGMQVIVAQMLSGLCFAVLASRTPPDDPVWADWGGLLLAALLGEAYLILMTFVVHWYGDQPDQAAWYLARSHGAWRGLIVGGAAIGAVGPIAALLFGKVRRSQVGLRRVALAVLLGLLAENIWLVAPAAGREAGWAILTGLVATVAVAALALCVAGLQPPARQEAAPDGA